MLSLEIFEGRNLMVLWAPGGQNRPYKVPRSVKTRNKDYRYYIRRYASTVEAKGEDERELISLTARIPFDDRYNQSGGLEDLSLRLMEEFLREVGSGLLDDPQARSLETLARQLNVAEGPDEALMPKNVGFLFFNEHPERFFPATQIDVV
jgi:ATP-dependent DNA helicase RecG